MVATEEEEEELQRPNPYSKLSSSSATAVVNDDPNFDRKLDVITAGPKPFVRQHLLNRISRENCQTIVNYILAMQTEISHRDRYRINTIVKVKRFAEVNEPKTFYDTTRQDVVNFLESFRKSETVDPLQRLQHHNTNNVNSPTILYRKRHCD
jgi:hypothetical protein